MQARNETARLADQYRAEGIVRIASFLPAKRAAALHADLRERSDWRQVFNSGDKIFELDRPARTLLDAERRSELDEAVYAGARQGFQYRYETIRIPDEEELRQNSADLLAGLATDLSEGSMRAQFHAITGASDIRFADLQATAYSPGDFLTGHDDDFPGKDRRAAYVLSLTPTWRIEWGGLFLLHGTGDSPAQAYLPAMNVLTLFAVPKMHSVSEVSRAAAYRRYSITGWLRA